MRLCLPQVAVLAVVSWVAAAAPLFRLAAHNRQKRFTVHGYKWHFTDLTWKFSDPHELFQKDYDFRSAKIEDHEIVIELLNSRNYRARLNPTIKFLEQQRHVVERSLTLWSRASGDIVRFTEVPSWSSGAADLDIYFARGDHGDFEAFDGTGGVVAHSAYPMDGQVHFDAAERWTLAGGDGLDLRYVSLHELGHALGLRHSDSPGAVMQPIYRSRRALALAEDDVLAIRSLYNVYIPRKKNMTEHSEVFKAR